MLNILLVKVGALTSKPYAFTARSWELKSIETIDFFDAYGSNIRVDVRGNDYMRVLPSLNKDLNEEWITDKVRFNYDGLKRQRLVHPLIKVTSNIDDGNYKKVNWSSIFSDVYFVKKISALVNIEVLVGDFSDIETIVSLNDFCLNWAAGTTQIYSLYAGMSLKTSFAKQYIVSNAFLTYDTFFLIGVNLRFESPILNLKLRKLVLNKNVKIFNWGPSILYNYGCINLGNSLHSLLSFLSGKSPLSYKSLTLNSKYAFIGASILQRFDFSEEALDVFFTERLTIQCISPLLLNSGHAGLLDIGVDSLKNLAVYEGLEQIANPYVAKVLYIMGADEVRVNSAQYDIVIYQGHHGDNSVNYANVVFSSSLIYEKNSTYMNFLGKYQRTCFVLPPAEQVRADWRIVVMFYNFLSNMENFSFVHYNFYEKNIWSDYNLEAIEKALSYRKNVLFSDFKKNSCLSNNISILTFKRQFKDIVLFNCIFSTFIYDFYRMDPISRSSHVMALSSKRFKQLNYNFK